MSNCNIIVGSAFFFCLTITYPSIFHNVPPAVRPPRHPSILYHLHSFLPLPRFFSISSNVSHCRLEIIRSIVLYWLQLNRLRLSNKFIWSLRVSHWIVTLVHSLNQCVALLTNACWIAEELDECFVVFGFSFFLSFLPSQAAHVFLTSLISFFDL